MKMHHHKKLLLFILQAALLSIQFPCFLSESKWITYNTLNPTAAYAKAPASAPDGSYYQPRNVPSPAPAYATAPASAPDGSYYQPRYVHPAPAYARAPASAPDGSYYQPRYDPRNLSPPKRIILGIISGIIGVIVVSITIYCSFKKQNLIRSPDEGSNQDIENILLQHGLLAPKRYKYSQIKKITKSFNDKLGQGGYGSVYKGTLPDGSLVAVKVLMETGGNGEEFINEVASIGRTSHVNIVNLLGFCYERNKKALVYEFMPNKSLDKFISSNAHYRLDMEKLYKRLHLELPKA